MRSLIIGRGSAGARHLGILSKVLPEESHYVFGSREWTALIQSGPGSLENWWHGHRPDLVMIASPASQHLEHLLSVQFFVVPVLIEKPLFSELAGFPKLDLVLGQMAESIQIGYVLRHSPSFRRFHQIVSQQATQHLKKVSVRAHTFLPDWRPNMDYRDSASAKSDLGGGALLELSHEIDYLLALFGDLRITGAFLGNSPLLEVDVETECKIEGVLSNGARLEMSLDMAERNEERWCHVEWENGLSIRWDIRSQQISTWQEARLLAREVFSKNRDDWYLAQLQHFLRVVSGEAQPLPGVHEGLRVMRVIEEVRSVSDRL